MPIVLQIVLGCITAAIAIYGAVLSTIDQIQIRRQTQRRLRVSVRHEIMQLPRIPDDQGGRSAAPVHVFVIQAINSGLLPVPLKDAGIMLSDGRFLTKALSPKHNKQFPLDLAPGDDHEVHVDSYDVLKAIRENGISSKTIVRCYFTTPLKQYRSKKVRLNVEALSNDVTLTEGAWRNVGESG